MTRFLYESKLPTFLGSTHCIKLYELAHYYDVQALRTACRIHMLRGMQSCNLVELAINGNHFNDDELKNAAISMMGKEHGPLSDLNDWECLEKHPALSLEIAERVKKDTT